MSDPAEILQYSPLSEYKAPSERSAVAARRIRRIWRHATGALRNRGRADDAERREPERKDTPVPAGALPRFELEAAADALARALGGWPDPASSPGRLRVVVGPPGSHVHDVVAELARRERWPDVEPPPRAALLEGIDAVGEHAKEIASDGGAPAVVRRLERWLLRSERALPLTRVLLEALRKRPSPVLVSCDSWAWSFLSCALGAGGLLGEPLALAPLDSGKLERWLGPPMRAQGLTCRPQDERDEAIFDADSDGGSRVLAKLAAAARGNPGVALELWGRSLRLATDRQDTVWALPASKAELDLPQRVGAQHDFVLHAILLHGGLERSMLLSILPLARHDTLRRLEELRGAGVVAKGETQGAAEEGDGGAELSITLAAYVPVRQRLAEEGFLVDGF